MSERLTLEHKERAPESLTSQPEALQPQAETTPSKSRSEKAAEVERIREAATQEALPTAETPRKAAAESAPHESAYIGRQAKAQAFNRTMKTVRKQLPAPEAAFSRIIHANSVDKVSEIAGQTVGRPSALIGGGGFALVGLALTTWFAKKNGFQLSGYEFLIFLIIGMLLGVGVEFLLRFLSKIGRD